MKTITALSFLLFIGITTNLSAQTLADSNQSKSHLDQGIELYNSHDYKGAISELNKAIKEDKKDGKAYYFRGMAKMHNGQKGFCKDLEESLKLKYVTSADIYYYGCDTHVKSKKK